MVASLLVQRELRVRAGHWTTFALRTGAALLGLVTCVQQLLVTGRTPAVVGRAVFDVLVGAAFILACSVSILSSSIIQTERREGTLGLLLLTKVSSLDVIVGKLTSSGLTSLYAVVALLPALMLPLLAGGVSGLEAARKGGALLATLWFGLAAGLCGASAQSGRSRIARGALLITGGFVLVPYLGFEASGHGFFRYAGLVSPLALVVSAGDSIHTAAPQLYWISILMVFLLGCALLFVAARLLDRAVRRDHGMTRQRCPKVDTERKRAIGMGRWRPEKTDSEPLEWLVYRNGIGAGTWLLAVLALVVSRWTALLLSGLRAGPVLFIALPFGLGAAALGSCLMALVVTRFLASAHGKRDLELLLTTPVGSRTIIIGQWNVLKRLFVWPVIVMELALLLPIGAIVGGQGGGSWHVLIMVSLNLANTALGIASLSWVGMRYALKFPSQTPAVLWTVALAQGVPWLVYLTLGVIPMVADLILIIFYVALLAVTSERLGREVNSHCRIPLPFSRVDPRVWLEPQSGVEAGKTISST